MMAEMVRIPAWVTHITTATDSHNGKVTTCVFGFGADQRNVVLLACEETRVEPAGPRPVGGFGNRNIYTHDLWHRVRKADREGLSHDQIHAIIDAEQGDTP